MTSVYCKTQWLSDLSPWPLHFNHKQCYDREIKKFWSRCVKKKRWSPSSSHSSLLDQYWSAGRTAVERFTPAFYDDDGGVWPMQWLKASQLTGGSIISSDQTWWPMRYADVSVDLRPFLTCAGESFWLCGKSSTFHSKYSLIRVDNKRE